LIAAPIVIAAAGWIGTLQIDATNAPAIVALHGRPEAEAVSTAGYRDPTYLALGYGCASRRAGDAWQIGSGGPYCRTIFWTDPATGAVGDFFTSSPVYAEAHGVRIGMPTAAAERRLHRHAQGGCSDAIHLGTLTIWFGGDELWPLPSHELRVIGGRVQSFFVTGRNELGIFDC
jgi:hypothetical protein